MALVSARRSGAALEFEGHCDGHIKNQPSEREQDESDRPEPGRIGERHSSRKEAKQGAEDHSGDADLLCSHNFNGTRQAIVPDTR